MMALYTLPFLLGLASGKKEIVQPEERNPIQFHSMYEKDTIDSVVGAGSQNDSGSSASFLNIMHDVSLVPYKSQLCGHPLH